MTRYDILKMNASALRIFNANKIDPKEVEKLAIFEEYTDMRNRGEKFNYTINYLREKYKVSPRSITTIAQRMSSEINVQV